MKTKKKFTAAQQAVVDLLGQGWELAISTSFLTSTPRTRHFLQQGKAGAGGKTQKVSPATFASLKELSAIKKVARKVHPFDAVYELDRDGLAALGHGSPSDSA